MRRFWRPGKPGIRARVLLVCAVIALAVALIASFLSYTLGYRSMREASFRELLTHAEVIVQREHQQGETLEVPSWETLELYQRLADALVFFVNPDYQAVHLSDEEVKNLGEDKARLYTQRVQLIGTMEQQIIARALMGETITGARTFDFTRGEMLFVCMPLQNDAGRSVGALILLQPVRKMMELGGALRSTLLISMLTALLLAFWLSWMFARTLTRPLLQITEAAQRMGEGEYNTRVDVQASEEVSRLGQTLNALSTRLGSTVARLMEERDQLEIIISSIDEGIVAVDTMEKIVRCNQATLELMEMERIDDLEGSDAEQVRRLADMLHTCLYTRKRQRGTWTSPSGRNILAVVSPLFGKNREILGGVALLQDVSEAERLEQLRRDYVANISHELRTPLTGIRGMVEPLLDGYIETEEEKADCYRVIYKETLRLEKLIGDMLDVSRLQNGRVQLEMERLDVRGIVDAALRRVQATAADAGIKLEADLPEGELVCIADENRVLQVLTIFLDNALSFTPSEGRVTVYAREEKGVLRLGVRDTGPGIEPKDLPFIWERFYKTDKSRMRTSGTGLGLAIAKLTVELMGGEIGVDTQPGEGSDFFFMLKQ